jgi:hypothetical protein
MPAPIGGAVEESLKCDKLGWAREFAEAVGQAVGKMAAQGFLTRQAVMKVGEELEAIA